MCSCIYPSVHARVFRKPYVLVLSPFSHLLHLSSPRKPPSIEKLYNITFFPIFLLPFVMRRLSKHFYFAFFLFSVLLATFNFNYREPVFLIIIMRFVRFQTIFVLKTDMNLNGLRNSPWISYSANKGIKTRTTLINSRNVCTWVFIHAVCYSQNGSRFYRLHLHIGMCLTEFI